MLLTSILVAGQDSPGVYTVKNAKINTLDSDFGTAFYGDDKVVFAAPKQGFTLSREENSGQPFLDLYVGTVTEDGQIIKKQKLPGEINTKYHEGMVSFTKDLKTVYFSANSFVKQKKNKKKNKKKATGYLHLFRADITDSGEWTNLTMLPFNGEKYSTGHPVLNRDDTKLYFVSDRPESYGKTDLFVVDINEDGSFSEPRNLGANINTSEREMFPFIGKDNVLYFSSDGLPGLGELDVFASKIFDNTQSKPINLQEPVNSEFDDFAYIIDDHKSRGYFSSNRDGGHGDDDIYSFVASPPIYIECLQEISGVVRDIDTQELIPDALIILYDAKGKELESFISSKESASFSFNQNCDANYTIKGYLEGYLIGELDIRTVNDLNAPPIELILHMATDPNVDPAIVAAAATSDLEKDAAAGLEAVEVSSEEVALSAQNDTGTTTQTSEKSSSAEGASNSLKLGENDTVESSSVTANKMDDSTESETSISGTTPQETADSREAEVAMEDQKNKGINSDSSSGAADVNEAKGQPKAGAESVLIGAAVVAGNSDEQTADKVQVDEVSASNDTKDEATVAENAQKSVSDELNEVSSNELTTPNPDAEIAMNMEEASGSARDANTATNPIEAGSEGIRINTIYFDFDKHDIRFDAKIELDKIAVVLKENPQTRIKVNSHTDSRGKKSYNSTLSNHRARKTVQYLLDQGIEEERISGEGHGELELAEVCTKQLPCTGLQHQLNRRSEFLIIDSFSDAVIAQSLNKSASGNYAVNKNVSNSGAYLNYDFSDNREVYTVQVGAFKGEVQNDKYKKLKDLFNYRYEDGLNRYYAGIFESSAEARIYMKEMRKNGFADAFVVGLKGTDRF